MKLGKNNENLGENNTIMNLEIIEIIHTVNVFLYCKTRFKMVVVKMVVEKLYRKIQIQNLQC